MGNLTRSFFLGLILVALAACSFQVLTPTHSGEERNLTPTPEPARTATLNSTPAMTSGPSSSPKFTSVSSPTSAPTPTPTPTPEPSATPTAVPTSPPPPETAVIDYGVAFGIDYRHPEQYLEQGEQSRITDLSAIAGLRSGQKSLRQLGDIYRWLKSDFTTYSAGGRTIGAVTVDQLLESRRLGGCHDFGLVYAAVARHLGYPALMARTNSIAWVERFQAGQPNPHVGHVFVEVYLNGRWLLIDSTNGWYVEEGYDPADPVIPLQGPIAGSTEEIYGFYVERKGLDVWDFGIYSQAESTQAMDEFASQLDLRSVTYPAYEFQRFGR